MAYTGESKNPKNIFIDVFGKRSINELWGSGYKPLMPVTPQDFSMGGVLTMIFYLMRWGHRRGKGKFIEKYGNPGAKTQKEKLPTIDGITDIILKNNQYFDGFMGNTEKTILADLFLAYCYENRRHDTGRDQPVLRVYPTHYFASWVDLPLTSANLRYIPELITTILAKQDEGEFLNSKKCRGFFKIGSGFNDNILLRIFANGVFQKGNSDDLKSDQFDEKTSVGLDQILTIRTAQILGEAPLKLKGENPLIINQWPIAQKAAKIFYEDFNIFLKSYSFSIPRLTLLPMLESCLALGLSNIFFSTLNIALKWEKDEDVIQQESNNTWPVFVDCSVSTDYELRRISEECMDDLMIRLRRLPVIMMCMKILNQWANDEKIKELPSPVPNPIEHIQYLGDLLFDRLKYSQDMKRDLRKNCNKLADAFQEVEEIYPIDLLLNEENHPAWRLSEFIVSIMGDKLQFSQFQKFFRSCLIMNEPNGIGFERKITFQGRLIERRSLVLNNVALDFLVHRYLRKSKKGNGLKYLSFQKFIDILREKYGFYIDEEPPGFSIPMEVLQRNRNYLERRLRDLGLLIGVNDAESMKRLVPRFTSENIPNNSEEDE